MKKKSTNLNLIFMTACASFLVGCGGSSNETQTNTKHLLSEKRGLGYGHHSLNDLAALEGGINWWYNWYVEPDSQVLDQYEDHNIEFVPMAWDENFDEPRLRAFLDTHPNVKYLLGFNEPNFAEQANLTPAEAAAQWPRVEAIADEYNLKIVGPAVNYSPGNVDIPNTDEDSDPWVYLDAFFAACEDCRVDYIAVHTYMKWDTAVDWFVGEFERYGKPIWVTEWAGWDEGGFSSVEGQMDYLAKTVRNMESNANVFRYAWFVGRTDGGANTFPYIDILGNDGELTPLGGLYTSIPATDYNYQIPVQIQAEGFHAETGVSHTTTADQNGYVDLECAAAGCSLEYKVEGSSANSTYQLQLRVANSSSNQAIIVQVDGQQVAALTLATTGSDQVYNLQSTTFQMASGQHTLSLQAAAGDFSLNWINIEAL
ncbi:MAG: glycosyl hydrolase [Pseudomonadota bacterium]|nr:glycosyl hydrolase [Pseudomonadota bacterium]